MFARLTMFPKDQSVLTSIPKSLKLIAENNADKLQYLIPQAKIRLNYIF